MITSIVQPALAFWYEWIVSGSISPYSNNFFEKTKTKTDILLSIHFLGDSIRIVCGINAVGVIVVQSSVTWWPATGTSIIRMSCGVIGSSFVPEWPYLFFRLRDYYRPIRFLLPHIYPRFVCPAMYVHTHTSCVVFPTMIDQNRRIRSAHTRQFDSRI